MTRQTKIQNTREVIRWFEEGRTYKWMQQQYREKYGIETALSMWGNFRSRHGLPRRINRDDDLIPWEVKSEHRWKRPVALLRREARLRAGMPLSDELRQELDAWKRGLAARGEVVDYDPDREEGFLLVPRRPGTDDGLIRKPDRKTTTRRRRE